MGRYEDLIAKRDTEGLNDEEANELGRLMADREGKPYGNASNPPPEVQEERADELEVRADTEVETERDVDDSSPEEEPNQESANPRVD